MADAYANLANTLLQAQQGAYTRNPYLASSQILNPANATTPYGSAATSVIQGLLAGYGMKSAGQEVAGMNQQVADAQRTGNFNALLQDPNLSQVGMQMAIGQQQRNMEMEDFIAKTTLGEGIKQKIAMAYDPRSQFLAQAAANAPIVGGDNPAGVAGQVPSTPPAPVVPASADMSSPAAAPMAGNDMSNLMALTNQLVGPGGQQPKDAMTAALSIQQEQNRVKTDRQVKEQALRDEYIKSLDESAQAADQLIQMGQKVTAAAPLAISGPGNGVDSALNEFIGWGGKKLGIDTPDANKAYNANQDILSISPDVLGLARKKLGSGSGTMSERDAQYYLAGGATLSKSPEQLMQYGDKYLLDGTLGKQSVDFKRMFITQGGNPAQAETIWTKYVDALKAQPGLTAAQVPDWKQALLPMLQGGQNAQQQQIQTPVPMGGAGPNPPASPPQGGSQGLTPSSPGNLLVSAIRSVESNPKNPNAVSSAGAEGPNQIMPDTAKRLAARLGITNYDPTNQQQQDEMTAEHLADSMERWGSLPLAIAAYNWGDTKLAGAVEKAGSKDWAQVQRFVPAETAAYVPKVLTNLKAMQGAPEGMPTVQLYTNAPQAPEVAAQQPTDLLGPGNTAQRMGRNIIGGLSANAIPFNVGDEVVAGGASAIDALGNVFSGERPGLSDAYDRRLQEIQNYQKSYNELSPTKGVAESIAAQAAMPVGKLFTGAKTALGSAVKIAGASGALGALYGAGAGGQGSGKGRGESAVETGLVSAAAGPILAGLIAGGTKLTSAAAEKLATSGIGQDTINALRAMMAEPQAGKIKIGGNKTLPPAATPEDVAILKLSQNPKVADLQKALETLQKGGEHTLPEAMKNNALKLQLKEMANNPDTIDSVVPAIGKRQLGSADRITEPFNKLSTIGTSAEGNKSLIEGAGEVISQAQKELRDIAAPAYDAMNKAAPVLNSPKMTALLESPTIKTYINSAKNHFDTELLPENSSEVVKKAISDMHLDYKKMAKNPMARGADVRDLGNDFFALKKEAYRLNPAMKDADIAYSKAMADSPLKEKGLKALGLIQEGDETQAISAIFGGGKDALTHTQIGAIRERFVQAGQEQQWNDFVKGYLINTIETAKTVTETKGAGVGSILSKLMGTPAKEKALEQSVGPALFPEIKAILQTEQVYLEGAQSLNGSQTYSLGAANESKRGIMSAIGNWKDFAIEGIGKLLTPTKDVEQYRRIAETLVNPQQSKEFLQRVIPLQKTLEGIRAGSVAIQKGATEAGIKSPGIGSGKKKKR